MNLYQNTPIDSSFKLMPAIVFSGMVHIILLLLLRDINLFEPIPDYNPAKKQAKILMRLNHEMQKSKIFLDTPDQMRDSQKHKIKNKLISNKTTKAADLSRKDTLPDDKAYIENGTNIPSVQAKGNQPSMDDLAPLTPGLSPIDTLMPQPKPIKNTAQIQRKSTKTQPKLHLPKTTIPKAKQKLISKPKPKLEIKQTGLVQVPKDILTKQQKQIDAPAIIKRRSLGQQNRLTHALERDMATYYLLEDKYGEYYKQIKRTIDTVWFSWWLRNKDISIGIRHKPAILTRCTIMPDGHIKNLTVFVDQDVDQFAANVTMEILKDSAPFGAFPKYIEESELPLYFNFHF